MRTEQYDLIDDVLMGHMSRRDLIKGMLAAGVSLSAIAGLLTEIGIGGEAEAAELAAPPLAPKRGGTLRIGCQVPAADTDPVSLFNQGAIFTMQLSAEYLCYVSPTLKLVPKLATSWHASNPSTWTFRLRKGVKWHDGSTFTADDVVATFDRLTDPKVNSAALSAFAGILSKGHTKKVDAHTVVFHLDRGYVDFPYLLCPFNYNAVILPKKYTIGDFVKGGVGTGPFILQQYTPKVGATYKKNPHYWAKGLPYLNAVNLKYYADNSAIVLALQGREIDAFPNLPYQGSQALFSNPNITILKNVSSSYREFHMRVDQKPFSDKRVRQAVAYSLNRPQLVQGLLHGLGALGNDHAFAPVYPLSQVTRRIPQRHQDYAKAKSLLAAAGHPGGIDVTLTYEDYLEIPQYAIFIQQQLKPAGIRVKLNKEDQNTYYGSGANQPWLDVPMGIVDWAPRGVPSQTIDPAYLTKKGTVQGKWNSAHWSNKTFDRLVNGSDKELNKSKREAMALKAARIQYDEVPAVIAYWLQDLGAIRKNVHAVPKGPGPYPDFSRTWLS
ncbi:MAG: ABC transporter substrate-binding protein [Chloroflexota bacterium]